MAGEIKDQWGSAVKKRADAAGFEGLKDDVVRALGDPKAAALWLEVARRLEAGDIGGLIEVLVELDRDVMWRRDKASAWVQMTIGKLDVHFADERARLPSGEQLAAYWVSPYYLGALRAIALELRRFLSQRPSQEIWFIGSSNLTRAAFSGNRAEGGWAGRDRTAL